MHGTGQHNLNRTPADPPSPAPKQVPVRSSVEVVQGVILVADAVIVLAMLALGVYLFGQPQFLSEPEIEQLTVAGSSAVAIFILAMGFSHGYKVDLLRSPGRQLSTVIWAWFTTFFVLGWSLFLLREASSISRGVTLSWFLGGLMVLALFHAAAAVWLRGRLERNMLSFNRVHAIFVGDGSAVEAVGASLGRIGVEVVAATVIPARLIGTSEFAAICDDATTAASRTLASDACEAVYLFAPWHQMRAIDVLRGSLSILPVPIFLFADQETRRVVRRNQIRLGSFDGYEIQRAPLSPGERAAKRLLDLAVASTALVLLSPVMLMTAVAILLETGRPILFRQHRKGVGGRKFSILKFRSMTTLDNGATVVQATRGDARITRVGQIIRRTSIDELPQLLNVLRGEMSIVGPRPHAVAHDDHYDRLISTYVFRHHVKPGITGWAQVNGYRGETRDVATMEARVEHDLWYINNWSLWLDIRIIVRTAFKVLADGGAY